MPPQTSIPLAIPNVVDSFFALTVDELKRYAAIVSNNVPTRKGELVVRLAQALTDPAEVRRLWEQLTPLQQQVVAEAVHNLGGCYNAEIIEAKYPKASAPQNARDYGGYGFVFGRGTGKKQATAFDLFFSYSSEVGRCIPSDLAVLLRSFVPKPAPMEMRSHDEPPTISPGPKQDPPPEIMVAETERVVFHDLLATLYLVQQGKVTVSATTRMPNLASLRHLRQRLLMGDYFAEQEYERAEDAIRPLALIMLVQAAKWAAPAGSGGKLELTRNGQALLAGPLEARHIREAWERWLKSDLLDELSRIRAIKGQQSKSVRLTKPAERREKLQATLRACPPGRWVELDDFFRYMRATNQSPSVERNMPTGLHIGSYPEYGWLGYNHIDYWDVVIGSYLRAVLWEYAATLGLIDIAYTRPEETPHSFGDLYGLDEYDYLSRYDGLLGLRLTNLGAYVAGLTDAYTPPASEPSAGPTVLKVLPNLDVVVTDASKVTPSDRAFLERVGTVQSQDVYRLSREQVLTAVEQGLGLEHVQRFLADKSGVPEAEWPQTVRTFFADLEQRMGALRDGGRVLLLEGDDPYLLTELAHTSELRSVVRLGEIDGKTVLLVPEDREAAVRRHLRKLGYIPRKN